jgi:hypothetical protein
MGRRMISTQTGGALHSGWQLARVSTPRIVAGNRFGKTRRPWASDTFNTLASNRLWVMPRQKGATAAHAFWRCVHDRPFPNLQATQRQCGSPIAVSPRRRFAYAPHLLIAPHPAQPARQPTFFIPFRRSVMNSPGQDLSGCSPELFEGGPVIHCF